jgi:hypothetical protein
MPEEQRSEKGKPSRAGVWYPSCCEECNLPYNPRKWKSDWSLSGEMTWRCPRCHHENYPEIK